jgi:hypothetical protein
MHCENAAADSPVIGLFSELFEQFRAIGQFTMESWPSRALDEGLLRTTGLLKSSLQAFENSMNLCCDAGETPFIFNTQHWSGSRVAGISDGGSSPRPSEILISFVACWIEHWKAQEQNCVSDRFLRGAAAVAEMEGLESAVSYLVDCYMCGLILQPQTLAWSIHQLLGISQSGAPNEPIIEKVFPDGKPKSVSEWLLPRINSIPGDNHKLRDGHHWRGFLVDLIFNYVEQNVAAISFNRWLPGRWRIAGLIDALLKMLDWEEDPSLSMRSAIMQLEEVRADAAGIQATIDIVSHFPYGLQSLHGVFNVVASGLRAEDEKGWRDRLHERFLIPTSIADQILAGQHVDISPEWQRLSSGYASAFAFNFHKKPDVTYVRYRPFTTEEVVESAVAQATLDEAAMFEPAQRAAILRRVGKSPLTFEPENKEWQDWFNNNEEPIAELCDFIHGRMVSAEIQSLIEVSNNIPKTSVSAKVAHWETMMNVYPYFHFAAYELAILFDELDQHAAAKQLVEQSILAFPHDSARWHSFAIILKRGGDAEEANRAESVAQMIARAGRPSG